MPSLVGSEMCIRDRSGTARLFGQDVNNIDFDVFTDVGVCLQVNALWENLTVEEHLRVFGQMKGLEGSELEQSVAYLMDSLGIVEFKMRMASELSGGNRRKLCVAIALLCSPSLLFLDEPSTGVDPVSRKSLWKTVDEVRKIRNGTTLLTTHSMSEAETVCQRIGIMVNGVLVCIGDLARLKEKYGVGYNLLIKKSPDSTGSFSIDEAIMEKFPRAIKLPQESRTYLSYQLPTEGFSLGEVFELFWNQLKTRNAIEDFSVSKCTLEQMFLSVGRTQRDESTSRVN
eukprot:TRINITY_DN11439_c0_g1_i2.p1 TRINITY_DN11439_c0_g1~~TRINITY_DN11439_c0_g1_i2.p1  ORF type:complete len:285 (-),score=35.28 TRINITY_DN11439_c0_g1_i2:113-967(-)